jgi:hypothetical protein
MTKTKQQSNPDMVAMSTRLSKEIAAMFAARAEAESKCGTCGRPWISGKCSGGFINHKQGVFGGGE